VARYGQKFKERVVARLLPPESSAVEAVSQTVGISVTTLERWRDEMLASPAGDAARHWTPAARLEAVIATAAMNEGRVAPGAANMACIGSNWRTGNTTLLAASENPATESAALKQERRRNKELERELYRKDKALAETAALLVLSKKLAAIFHDGEDA
jgi:transposase-like protein